MKLQDLVPENILKSRDELKIPASGNFWKETLPVTFTALSLAMLPWLIYLIIKAFLMDIEYKVEMTTLIGLFTPVSFAIVAIASVYTFAVHSNHLVKKAIATPYKTKVIKQDEGGYYIRGVANSLWYIPKNKIDTFQETDENELYIEISGDEEEWFYKLYLSTIS
jgi:hypothetical protein